MLIRNEQSLKIDLYRFTGAERGILTPYVYIFSLLGLPRVLLPITNTFD